MRKCFVCNHESYSEKLLKCYLEERLNKGGQSPSKSNKNEKFCHLLCSMFFPELIFQSSGGEFFFTGMQKIKQDNYLEDCYKCVKNPNGNCMARCWAKGCYRYFHVNCLGDFKFFEISKPTDPCLKFSIVCDTKQHESSLTNIQQLSYSQVKAMKEKFYEQKIMPFISKIENIDSQKSDWQIRKKPEDFYDDYEVVPCCEPVINNNFNQQITEGKQSLKIGSPEKINIPLEPQIPISQSTVKSSNFNPIPPVSDDLKRVSSCDSFLPKNKTEAIQETKKPNGERTVLSIEQSTKSTLGKMKRSKTNFDQKKNNKRSFDKGLISISKVQFMKENTSELDRYKPVPYPKDLNDNREEEMNRWWASIDEQYFRESLEGEQKNLSLEGHILTGDLLANQMSESSHLYEQIKSNRQKQYYNFRMNRKEIIDDMLPLKNNKYLHVLFENKSEPFCEIEPSRTPHLLVSYELNPESLDLQSENGCAKPSKYKLIPGQNTQGLDRYIENTENNSRPKPYSYFQSTQNNENQDNRENDSLILREIRELDIKSYYSCFSQQKIINEVHALMQGKGLKPDELTYEIICLTFFLKEIHRRNERRRKNIPVFKESAADVNNLKKEGRKLQNLMNWNFMRKLFQQGFKDKNKEHVLTLKSCRGKSEYPINEVESPEKKTNKTKGKNKTKTITSNGSADFLETDCSICFNNYTNEINPVVYCSSCNISFHQYCYGIEDIPTEDYHCEVCSHFGAKSTGKYVKKKEKERIRQSSVDCLICCQNNRPLKYINDNWFHVTCLILYDYARLKDGLIQLKKNSTIANICRNILDDKYSQQECEICYKKDGLKMSCNQKECSVVYHSMCAYLNGYYFSLGSEDEESKDWNTYKPLDCVSKCFRHSLEMRDLKKQVYYRRFAINYRQTANYLKKKEYFEFLKSCKIESPLLRKSLEPELLIPEEDIEYFRNMNSNFFSNQEHSNGCSSKRSLQEVSSNTNHEESAEGGANTRKKFKKNSIDNQQLYNNIFD